MIVRWVKTALMVATMLLAWPAAAQMVPCPSEPIDTLTGVVVKGFTCVEVERAERAGVLYRIVANKGTPERALSPYREMLGDIVEHSFAVWKAVRPVDTRAITFVLLPAKTTPPELIANGALAAAFDPKLGWNDERECLVLVNAARMEQLLAEQGTAKNRGDFAGIVIAHELAHCVQDWGWRTKAMAPAAHWWVEGSAELLGAVAYPKAIDIFRRRYPLFRKNAGSVPLTQMAYESVVFFQWIWNHRHADIFGFMDAMPACAGTPCASANEEAQRKATIAFLGKAQGGEGGARIQVFAQQFVDNEIPNAAGAPMGLPEDAPKQLVTDTAEVPIGGTPWTIQTRDLTVAKGDYISQEFSMLQSARARDASYPAPWGDLPLTIRPGCKGQTQFKLAFVPLNQTAAKAYYRLEKGKGCETAEAGSRACPVGAWTVDPDSHKAMLASWIGKDGRVDSVTGTVDFTFTPEGIARLVAKNFTANATPILELPTHISVGVTGADEGSWTVKGGQLTFTGGKGLLSAKVAVTIGSFSHTMNDQFLFERGSVYDYACASGTLTLRYAGPRSLPADRRPVWHLVHKAS